MAEIDGKEPRSASGLNVGFSGPSSSASTKSSTLPLSHRLSLERPGSAARDREGYYSDRNELMRERERDRGYLSDHNTSRWENGSRQSRGAFVPTLLNVFRSFLRFSRCASCLGESSRAQWFRHSDGWRSGSSAFGSGTGSGIVSQSSISSHKRSPWDSLPSLRHDNSRDDSSYKSTRADSFDQRSLSRHLKNFLSFSLSKVFLFTFISSPRLNFCFYYCTFFIIFFCFENLLFFLFVFTFLCLNWLSARNDYLFDWICRFFTDSLPPSYLWIFLRIFFSALLHFETLKKKKKLVDVILYYIVPPLEKPQIIYLHLRL